MLILNAPKLSKHLVQSFAFKFLVVMSLENLIKLIAKNVTIVIFVNLSDVSYDICKFILVLNYLDKVFFRNILLFCVAFLHKTSHASNGVKVFVIFFIIFVFLGLKIDSVVYLTYLLSFFKIRYLININHYFIS